MATRLNVSKQLEKSAVPFSVLTTDVSSEIGFTPPGANGTVLTIVAGVPTFVGAGVTANWALTANTGLVEGTDNLFGTTDAINVRFVTNGTERMRLMQSTGRLGIGITAPTELLDVNGNINLPTTTSLVGQLKINATRFLHAFGTNNTFVGSGAGNFTLTGAQIVAVGFNTLTALIGGTNNVGIGGSVMNALTSGNANTAVGTGAGGSLLSGSNNVIFGQNAAFSLTTGSTNISIGRLSDLGATASNAVVIGDQAKAGTAGNNIVIGALSGNITMSGASNTVVGQGSATGLTSATRNVFIGSTNSVAFTSGFDNVIIGHLAKGGTSGSGNIVIGENAGSALITGSSNTAVGTTSAFALAGGSNNVMLGSGSGQALNSGTQNTLLGTGTGGGMTSGGNNVQVGYLAGFGISTGSGSVIIGSNTTGYAIAGARSNVVLIGNDTLVTSDGQGNISNTAGTLQLGVNNTNPLSYLDVTGSFAGAIRTVVAATSLTITDHTLLANAAGGAFTVTLPTAASCPRRIYVIKKINATAPNVTVDAAGAETIDSALTFVLAGLTRPSVMIQSDGAAWHILANF